MTETESGLQDPAASSGPQNANAEARFFKSLIPVLKDNRDVLSRLPELMEQCLNKEPLNSDLAESRLKEENRYKYLTMLNDKPMLRWKENLWFIFGELVYTCEIAESIMTRGDRMFCKDRISSLHYTQGTWRGKVSRKETKRLGKKVGINGVRHRRKD